MISKLLGSTYAKATKEISDQSESYAEWFTLAQDSDLDSGMEEWKNDEECDLYDFEQIRIRLDKLRGFKKKGDHQGLLFTLNEGIHGNMGGYRQSKVIHPSTFWDQAFDH